VRREITAPMSGSVDGLTAMPSCSSKWSRFMVSSPLFRLS
jgi:hypothetical protein